MQIPENWDNIECIRINTPTENYYILKTINVTEGLSNNGNDILRMEFDIAEGEFQGFFTMMGAKHQKNLLLKYIQLTQKESALPYFKTLLKNFEYSNDGYTWDFSYPQGLKGKKIGAYLMSVPYVNKEGKEREVLKIDRLYSIEYVKNKMNENVADEIKNRKEKREQKELQAKQREAFKSKQEEIFDDLPF